MRQKRGRGEEDVCVNISSHLLEHVVEHSATKTVATTICTYEHSIKLSDAKARFAIHDTSTGFPIHRGNKNPT